MPNYKLVPELTVSNLEVSRHFYLDILGFKVKFERPEDRFIYMSFFGVDFMIEEDRKRDGISALWIIHPLDHPRGRGLNLSIDCPDASDLVQRLQKANVALRKPLEDHWYRNNEILHGERNFLVQDPDGFLLRFAESLGDKPVEQDY